MQQQTRYDDDELVTRSTPRCCLRRGRCPHRPAGLCVRAALAGCTRCHSCCRGALYMRPAQPPEPPGPGTQRTRFGRICNPPLRTCPRFPRRGGLYGRPGPGPDSRRSSTAPFAVGARITRPLAFRVQRSPPTATGVGQHVHMPPGPGISTARPAKVVPDYVRSRSYSSLIYGFS